MGAHGRGAGRLNAADSGACRARLSWAFVRACARETSRPRPMPRPRASLALSLPRSRGRCTRETEKSHRMAVHRSWCVVCELKLSKHVVTSLGSARRARRRGGRCTNSLAVDNPFLTASIKEKNDRAKVMHYLVHFLVCFWTHGECVDAHTDAGGESAYTG